MNEPHKAHIRVTATLPTGLIVWRVAHFDWPKGTKVDLSQPMRPLFDWLVDEFGEWVR